MVNWTAKANLIGGIYGRPIAIGNFVHFVMAALALIKLAIKTPANIALIVLTIIYVLLGVMFAYVFFTHPSGAKKN
jgi:quinol-cytochrome oxidoreductase complex cytochrome b subunit